MYYYYYYYKSTFDYILSANFNSIIERHKVLYTGVKHACYWDTLAMSCQWTHTGSVLLCLASLPGHNVKVHPHCRRGQNVLPSQGWIIFRGVKEPRSVYPFTRGWAPGPFPPLGLCEGGCYEPGDADVSVGPCFIRWACAWGGVSGNSMFNFCGTTFYKVF